MEERRSHGLLQGVLSVPFHIELDLTSMKRAPGSGWDGEGQKLDQRHDKLAMVKEVKRQYHKVRNLPTSLRTTLETAVKMSFPLQ